MRAWIDGAWRRSEICTHIRPAHPHLNPSAEQDAHEIVDCVNECIVKAVQNLEKDGKHKRSDIKVIGECPVHSTLQALFPSAILDRLLITSPRPRVYSTGITNQRETTIVWDKKTGKALTRAIAWPDTRTTHTIRQLSAKSEKGTDAVKTETGLPLCELQTQNFAYDAVDAKRASQNVRKAEA